MKTSDEELRRQALILPPGFETWVILRDGNHGKVRKPSDSEVFDVHIKKDGAGGLDVECSCSEEEVCSHIAAFYGVVKNIKSMRTDKDTPDGDEGKQPPPEPLRTGRQMIADAMEMLIDGMWRVLHEKEE